MILYIDPGTGSMLVTIIIGLLGTALYFLRNVLIKIKFFGKGKDVDDNSYSLLMFSDHKRYWNIFKPICDELEKRDIKAIYMTESEDDPALEAGYKNIEAKYIGNGNIAYAKMNNIRAKIVLSTTPSLDVFQWKRSKYVDYYIHIAHMPNDIIFYKMFGLDYYDAILLSGEYQCEQIRKLEELRNMKEKRLEIVGLPYLDALKQRFDEYTVNNNSKERTILLAPTWGDNGILSKYGAQFIEKLLKTGYKIIIRPHPQSFTSEKKVIDILMEKFPNSDKIEWNRDNDNFEVMCNSDVLISDFSGIVFEYAMVFDKPFIYTKPDLDKSTYDCAWVDDELWTFKTLPRIGKELSPENFDRIDSIVEDILTNDVYKEGRETARKETWMYKGEGAQRVVDFIEKIDEELREKAASA